MSDETEECFHQNLQYRYHLTSLVDGKEIGASNVLQVSAMCKDCSHVMRFVGLPHAVTLGDLGSEMRPSTPDDGMTICIPMVAGDKIAAPDAEAPETLAGEESPTLN